MDELDQALNLEPAPAFLQAFEKHFPAYPGDVQEFLAKYAQDRHTHVNPLIDQTIIRAFNEVLMLLVDDGVEPDIRGQCHFDADGTLWLQVNLYSHGTQFIALNSGYGIGLLSTTDSLNRLLRSAVTTGRYGLRRIRRITAALPKLTPTTAKELWEPEHE